MSRHKVAEDGDWEIHNSPEKRLIPIHRCTSERTVPDHERGRRMVQWKLPCEAAVCPETGTIYCQRCLEPLPEELVVMMKLSGSHLKLVEMGRYFSDEEFNESDEEYY